jgi:hypothetical protein
MHTSQGFGAGVKPTPKNGYSWVVRRIDKFMIFGFVYFVSFFKFTQHYIGSIFFGKGNGQQSDWFVETFQLDSDMLVRERIDTNLNFGIFHHIFFLGNQGEYESQIGFGGFFLALPTSLLSKLNLLPQNSIYATPIDPVFSGNFLGITIAYALVAVLNGALAAYLTVRIWEKTNLLISLIVMGILLQPWSLAINGSLYWFMSLKFFPVITLILARRLNFSQFYTFFAAFLAFIISFASGYEFATVVVAAFIATDYVLNPERYTSYKKVISRFVFSLLLAASSLISTLTIHLLLLSMIGYSRQAAFDTLSQTVNKRTGVSSLGVQTEYLESLSIPPSWVLKTYLNMPILGAPYKLGLLSAFTVGFLVIIMFFVSLFRFENVNRFLSIEAWLICLTGPIGWYLLARPHSAGHTHINFAIWFFPTIPLGLAILVDRIQKFKSESKFKPLRPIIVWVHFLLFVSILYFLSIYTVRI